MDQPQLAGGGMSKRGRLHAVLDIAATVMSLVGGVAVVLLAATIYARQRPQPRVDRTPEDPVSIESAALQGSPAAPFVLVVFSDFQCPYCRDFANGVLPQVVEKLVRPGEL